MKEVINVLWAIEKDLRVIASNTEVLKHIAETVRECYFPGKTQSLSELEKSVETKYPNNRRK